jgi:hypothetical protein
MIVFCFSVMQMDETNELVHGSLGSRIQETFDSCYSALVIPYLKLSQSTDSSKR